MHVPVCNRDVKIADLAKKMNILINSNVALPVCNVINRCSNKNRHDACVSPFRQFMGSSLNSLMF